MIKALIDSIFVGFFIVLVIVQLLGVIIGIAEEDPGCVWPTTNGDALLFTRKGTCELKAWLRRDWHGHK